MPRSGGGRFEALLASRMRGGARTRCASLRPPAVASIGSSSRCDAGAAAGADHVKSAAVTGHDPVQFGQRLDLVDDDLAHLRGALGGFLRHFQHAAAQLVAGGFQLVLHFRRPSASCS